MSRWVPKSLSSPSSPLQALWMSQDDQSELPEIQPPNHPTSLLQGTANGVCCTACEMPCIKQKSFQRGKTQLINGSPALTPTAKPSFLDSATDLGKKITQEKVYPHVAFHGLHCTNQTCRGASPVRQPHCQQSTRERCLHGDQQKK